MTSDPEIRLNAAGLELEEEDFGRDDEPDVDGCALVGQREGGLIVRLVIRPDLAEEFRAGFAEWALTRVQRFAEHGPEPDGWQKRSDDDWQLWARHHELPNFP